MSARDEDLDDDDPMLRGMRGVWREMRDGDEEPPTRGLDALMAAARVQAAAMKPAEEEVPWWRRAFAMMLRPPVLAAATVIVLVGGAVALKSRGADELASPTAVTAKQGDPDMGGERQKKDEARPMGAADAAVVETETVVATPKADPPTEKSDSDHWKAGNGQATPPPVVAKPPGRPAPERRLEEQTKPEPKKQERKVVKQDDGLQAPKDRSPQQQPQNGLVIANDGEGDTKPADKKPAVKTTARPPAKPEPPPADALEVTGMGGRQQSTIEQLIKQAETAASRNDCAAVKVTVERIRKLDVNVYKSRVANQPAIAKCLK